MSFKSFKKTNLLESFLSIGFLQFINMLLPLIVLPYLVRVIEPDYFGLVSVALSVIMLFNLFVEFGFNLSATKSVAVNRDQIKKVSDLFFTVWYSKILLLILSISILFFLSQYIDYISGNRMLFYVTFGLVIGNLMLPVWFFLGLEKMKYITIITVTLKVFATVSVFFFIKERDDYILFPLINSIATIISGVIAFFFAIFKFNLIFVSPSYKRIIEQLRLSFHFFLSRFATQGGRHVVIALIGSNFGNLIVGFYAMADKLYMATMSIGGVVSQALYPFMSAKRDINLFKKISTLLLIFIFIILFPCIYFNEELLLLLFDLESQMLSRIFVVLMLSLPFGIISQLVGYPLLAAFNFDKDANNSLIFSSMIYLLTVSLILLFNCNIYYIAAAVFFYNTLRVGFAFYYIRKNKIIYYGK